MQTSPLMLEEIRRGMKPVERLSLADYCDKRRIIPPGKPMPGPWKTSRVEPWRAVYSYFDNPRTREIGVMGAAQTAKSETQTNTIAKTIEIDPKPILIIKPSLNNLGTYIKDSLDPTIKAMPGLRSAIQDVPKEDKSDTLVHKRFKGEWLYGGVPTLNHLCERAACIGLADEVSLWPRDIQGEGDGYDLLKKRLSNYYDHKLIAVSKPGLKGCRISTLYNELKRHVWMWKCPVKREGEYKAGCGAFFELDFIHMAGCDDHNTAKSWVKCPECGYQIRDDRRLEASYGGYFLDLDPDKNESGVSFQMSGIMFPWVSFESALEQYLRADGDPARVKTFTNQILGLPFEPGQARKAQAITIRDCNRYEIKKGIPKHAPLLTSAVDIQDKGEAVIHWMAWTPQRTGYSVYGERMKGMHPSKQIFWDELAARLKRKFYHEAGVYIDAEAVIIDTGHRAREVYKFLHDMQSENNIFVGYKGDPGWSKPMITRMKGNVGLGKTLNNIFKFATWDLQRELYEKYLIKPGEDGSVLFPADWAGPVNEDYLSDAFWKDLTAYTLYEKTLKSGEIFWEWSIGKKIHDFNDTIKMSLGLLHFLNPVWEIVEDGLSNMAKEARGEKDEETGCQEPQIKIFDGSDDFLEESFVERSWLK